MEETLETRGLWDRDVSACVSAWELAVSGVQEPQATGPAA